MKVTENMEAFTAACLDTPFEAVAVKKHNYNIMSSDMMDFGVLVSPMVMQGPKADAELERVMQTYDGVVTVRGHGWMTGETFVWTGTAREFNQTWRID